MCARDNDKSEMTPAMIEAGASVLYGMELAFASEEFWAKEVYTAMARLRPDLVCEGLPESPPPCAAHANE